MAAQLLPGLERKLKAEITGDVMFDRFSRGRYATDASHYQMMPVGVVAPRTAAEAERAIALAREEGVSVLARGGGTSQAGQTVNSSLVIDCSKHLTQIYEIDVGERRCAVEPGIVLDDLNRKLQALRPLVSGRRLDRLARDHRRHGGEQFLRRALAALRHHARQRASRSTPCWPTAPRAHFGPVAAGLSNLPSGSPLRPLARSLLDIGLREADEIEARFPKVQRRVGGYNLDAFAPNAPGHNLAHILVGSEGTLAFSTRIELKLSPVLGKPRGRRLPLRLVLRGDERRAASGEAQADRGRAGRPHHAGARRRDRDVPPDAEGLRAAASRKRSCWSSSTRARPRTSGG